MKSRGLVAANRIEYYVAIAFLFAFILVRNLGYGWSLIGRAGTVHSRYFAVKTHSIDDSRYGPHVTNLTPGSDNPSDGPEPGVV
jgi:hypothetical protein